MLAPSKNECGRIVRSVTDDTKEDGDGERLTKGIQFLSKWNKSLSGRAMLVMMILVFLPSRGLCLSLPSIAPIKMMRVRVP